MDSPIVPGIMLAIGCLVWFLSAYISKIVAASRAARIERERISNERLTDTRERRDILKQRRHDLGRG